MASDRDIHENADADHHAEDAGAAVGNERQSNADDGSPAHDHGRIDGDLPKEDSRNADGEQHSEAIARRFGDMECPQEEA